MHAFLPTHVHKASFMITYINIFFTFEAAVLIQGLANHGGS